MHVTIFVTKNEIEIFAVPNIVAIIYKILNIKRFIDILFSNKIKFMNVFFKKKVFFFTQGITTIINRLINYFIKMYNHKRETILENKIINGCYDYFRLTKEIQYQLQ